jgi:hypothetical protein
MIIVELRRPNAESGEYECVATLTVHDDGGYDVTDPEQLFPIDLHVLVPSGSQFLPVEFAEDRETWARHLGSLLRTGYLVPVTVRDDSTRPAPSP